MASLNMTFDANGVDPSQSAGGLPIGKHKVVVAESEVKQNSSQTGGYVELLLKVIEGPETGQMGYDRLNLWHDNEKAVSIAQQRLSAYCHVTGVFIVSDTAQLHNIPFMVEVAAQKDKPEYTEVKRLYDASGNEPNKAGSNPPQQQPNNQGFNQGNQAQQPNQAANSNPWNQGGQQQQPNNQGSQQAPWG